MHSNVLATCTFHDDAEDDDEGKANVHDVAYIAFAYIFIRRITLLRDEHHCRTVVAGDLRSGGEIIRTCSSLISRIQKTFELRKEIRPYNGSL